MNYLEQAEAYEMLRETNSICSNCEEEILGAVEQDMCIECYEHESAIKLREAVESFYKNDTRTLEFLHNAIDNANFIQL